MKTKKKKIAIIENKEIPMKGRKKNIVYECAALCEQKQANRNNIISCKWLQNGWMGPKEANAFAL